MRALIIDDVPSEARCICLILSQAGIEAESVDSGELALNHLSRSRYSVVLLDLMLPDIDGYEVLRRMRAAGDDTPVLALSGVSATNSKLKAFSGGVDDYLVKPFDNNELIARTLAVIQRHRSSSTGSLRVGPLTLNPDNREVRVHDQKIELTNKEYEILELLVLREGIALTKEAFMVHLYSGKDRPEEKIIDVFICKLRKKLAKAGVDHLIGTVWGSGFIMRDPNFFGNAVRQNISHAPVPRDKFPERTSGDHLSNPGGR